MTALKGVGWGGGERGDVRKRSEKYHDVFRRQMTAQVNA